MFVNNRKKLYEHYAGMFPSKDIFEQVFQQVTNNLRYGRVFRSTLEIILHTSVLILDETVFRTNAISASVQTVITTDQQMGCT